MPIHSRSVVAVCSLAALLHAQGVDAPLVDGVKAADWFRIEAHGAPEADVELTGRLLCRTVVRLRAMFGVEATDRCLRGIDCVVSLHGKPTPTVTEGHASLVTGTRDGRYRATIEILAPSAFSASYRDIAGLPAGADHHLKVLAHEYATVLLDRLVAEKPEGWRFFTAPNWFVQGYEEYLGVSVLHESVRDDVFERWARIQGDPNRVRFHPSFAVEDAYLDGAVVLHFLHESFGGERVRAVLRAEQRTFEAALLATLGCSWNEIERRWKVWREDALARADWRKNVDAAKEPAQIAAAVVGRDLRRLPEDVREKVVGALRTLAGKEEYWRRELDGSPHRVYRVSGNAAHWALLVTFEGEVPGHSWLAVHFFDASWQQIAVDRFATGYRISLLDVWEERVDALREPVFAVRLGSTGSFGNYTYRQRQYYAVRDGRLALVRLEDEGESATRGSFAASRPWTGPPPPERTVARWIETLSSPDPATVLETLTWLGGGHLSSDEPRHTNVNQERVEDSKLWESVRDDPATRPLLEALAKSENRWLREAAKLTLRPTK